MIRYILSAFLFTAPLLAADDVVARAMHDELERSMQKLQLENLQKPYFIAYRIVESETCTVSASFGALVINYCTPPTEDRHGRQLGVEVRVGDYTRDNTNFYAFRMQASGVVRTISGAQIPMDDNYDEIRRELWLATDSAYKEALDVYAKKKAALENRTRTGDAPDFSKETALKDTQDAPKLNWKPEQIVNDVKALSAIFRSTPGIADSEVKFTGSNSFVRYENSEGTTFTRRESLATYQASANTQAVDGMPLSDCEVVHSRTTTGIPSKEEMANRVKSLAARLEKLRAASTIDRYTGPVLFEGQAAGELVAQALGNGIYGLPRLVVDDSRFESVFASDRGSFADKVGGKVLPESFSLIDDATLRTFAGKLLLGGYNVDEDGVKARANVLVEKGVMKQLLRSRALIPNTTASTASRRAGTGASPSNLILNTDKPVSAEQIRTELINLVKARGKEYGIIVRRVANWSLAASLNRGRMVIITSSGADAVEIEPIIEAYKIFPDGREELVRNLKVTGLTLASFKDITAATDANVVYSAPFRAKRMAPSRGMPFVMGQLLVSVVTPSLLFDDMTLQKPTGEVPNLPFTKHPYFDK